jgi:hypothetical protein
MPIYEVRKEGDDKSRMIKAKDAPAALSFAKVATIKPVSAERMLELQGEGVTLEVATDAADPASHAPGGALHGSSASTGGDAKSGKGAGDN